MVPPHDSQGRPCLDELFQTPLQMNIFLPFSFFLCFLQKVPDCIFSFRYIFHLFATGSVQDRTNRVLPAESTGRHYVVKLFKPVLRSLAIQWFGYLN